MSPSVVVVGAGAIGGWIADALDRAGWRVSLLARGATLARLRSHGLSVERSGIARQCHPRAGSAAELGVHDFIVLTVKAHNLSKLAPTLLPLIGPASVVMSGTNGIPWWFFHQFGGPLADQRLESVDPEGTQDLGFPRERIIGSVVHASVRVMSAARIEVVAADRMLIGDPRGTRAEPVAEMLAGLEAGGINAQFSDDIRREIWAKLWGNMSMNPLSALTRCGTYKLLHSADVRELCVRMMEEMQSCGAKLGLDAGMTPQERMALTLRLGDFKTSMLADLEAGVPLELAPQLGAVCEIAGRLQIAAPFMRAILGLTRLVDP